MVNGVFAFDLGAESIKISKWNPSTNKQIQSSAVLVYNDSSNCFSNVSVSIKQGNYSVCDHAFFNSKTNLSSYIWNIKGLIGDHQSVKHLEADIDNFKHRKTLKLDTNRAFYELSVDHNTMKVDVESVMSLLFEYFFYINLKKEDDLYDNVTSIVQEGKQECKHTLISIPSYYTQSNIRGLQVALDGKSLGEGTFVRDYIAVCVDYGYHRNLVGEFDSSSQTVLFVNMGHSYTFCALARYSKNFIEVLDHRYCMLGGIDFTTALYREIKNHYLSYNPSIDFNSLSTVKKEKMERQFWDCADKAKKEFAYEGLKLTEIEIDNYLSKDDDSLYTFELTDSKVYGVWKELIEEFVAFVDGFVESHTQESIHSVEIVGGAMRLPILKESLSNCVKRVNVQTISNTLNMSESVSRGLATIGQEYYDEEMVMGTKRINLQYSFNDHSIQHEMDILGFGPCTPVSGKLCVSVVGDDVIEEGVDHDWSAILTQFSHQSILRPSVLGDHYETINDSDDSDDSELDKQVSLRDSMFLGKQRYSRIPQDDSIMLEFSGTYSLRSTFDNKRNFIVNRETGKKYGYASTQYNQLNGEYCLYYDEGMTIVQERCNYINGEKDGEWCLYYNNQNNTLHRKCEYDHGKKVNHLVSYYPTGQMECIIYYEKGVEYRRNEFFENGYLKRISERADNDVHTWKIVEFDLTGMLMAVGFGKRDQKDNNYVYSFAGEGCLYCGNKFRLQGLIKDSTIHIDQESGYEEYSIQECRSMIRQKRDSEGFYLLYKDTPWEKLDRKKDKENVTIRLNGNQYKCLEYSKASKGKKEIFIARNLFGYPAYKVERTREGYTRTDFYPLPGEGKICNMGLFTINPVMDGIYDKVQIARIQEFDKDRHCVKDITYLNTGKEM